MSEELQKVYAVCGIIVNKEGKVLGVSRKNNSNDFGLPGGKVDSGETPKEALKREIFEETGLLVNDMSDCVFFRNHKKGIVQCFKINSYSGEINTKESGVVDWVDKEKLCVGSFGEYNTVLFKNVKI